VHAATAAIAAQAGNRASARVLGTVPSGWRNGARTSQHVAYNDGERTVDVAYRFDRGALAIEVDGSALPAVQLVGASPEQVDLQIDGVRRRIAVHRAGDVSYVDSALGSTALTEVPRFTDPTAAQAAGSLLAPMPGGVVRVLAAAGDPVSVGQALLVLEAMKMEHTVTAPVDGVLSELHVAVGQQVDSGQVLAVLDGGART